MKVGLVLKVLRVGRSRQRFRGHIRGKWEG